MSATVTGSGVVSVARAGVMSAKGAAGQAVFAGGVAEVHSPMVTWAPLMARPLRVIT